MLTKLLRIRSTQANPFQVKVALWTQPNLIQFTVNVCVVSLYFSYTAATVPFTGGSK